MTMQSIDLKKPKAQCTKCFKMAQIVNREFVHLEHRKKSCKKCSKDELANLKELTD